MKLAIVGTHSTGKTTLISTLAKAFESQGKRVVIVPEMARLCPFPINEGTTAEAQKWILEKQISEENSFDDSEAVVICDRATIDNFAYFFRHCAQFKPEEDLAPWEALAVDHASTYDAIFKTQKLAIAAEADGDRAVGEVFRQEMDDIITRLLEKYSIPHILLPPTPDYAAHVAFITEYLHGRDAINRVSTNFS